MENTLTFIAQGKQRHYPGKNTIMDALDEGNEVELTFFADDNDRIVIINHLGEVSGCLPKNPATMDDYVYLRTHLDIGSQIKAKAIPHNVFYYGVEATITI